MLERINSTTERYDKGTSQNIYSSDDCYLVHYKQIEAYKILWSSGANSEMKTVKKIKYIVIFLLTRLNFSYFLFYLLRFRV